VVAEQDRVVHAYRIKKRGAVLAAGDSDRLRDGTPNCSLKPENIKFLEHAGKFPGWGRKINTRIFNPGRPGIQLQEVVEEFLRGTALNREDQFAIYTRIPLAILEVNSSLPRTVQRDRCNTSRTCRRRLRLHGQSQPVHRTVHQFQRYQKFWDAHVLEPS